MSKSPFSACSYLLSTKKSCASFGILVEFDFFGSGVGSCSALIGCSIEDDRYMEYVPLEIRQNSVFQENLSTIMAFRKSWYKVAKR